MIMYQRLNTYSRFETEVRGNSEMAYYRWFAFVLTCGDCSVCFAIFVINQLVIAPVRKIKKLQ